VSLTPLRQWRISVFVGEAMKAVAETTVFATPVIVLTIYPKNEKANLSVAERNALAKMIAELKTARARKETRP
jgi:hypothetical protein